LRRKKESLKEAIQEDRKQKEEMKGERLKVRKTERGKKKDM